MAGNSASRFLGREQNFNGVINYDFFFTLFVFMHQFYLIIAIVKLWLCLS